MLAIGGGIATALQGGDDKHSKQRTSAAKPTDVASPTPSVTPTPEASESAAAGDQALTVSNNKEFAALLHVGDYCDESIGRFADKYEGKTIEFDGSVVDVSSHGDYDTRYDILLGSGDKGPKTVIGPLLKFENVNLSDLKFTGANQPGSIEAGDRLHLVAQVGDFTPTACILFLDPVSTEVR